MTEARVLTGGSPEDRVALVVDPEPPRGPRILWYGDWDGPAGDRVETAPLPVQRWGARLDDPIALTLVPAAGTGHPGPPGLECRTAASALAFVPDTVRCCCETDAWVIEQTDEASGVAVVTRLAMDRPTGALCVTTRVCNEGSAPLWVDWLAAATLPLPDWCEEVEHVAGDWCGEFRRQRTRPGEGSWLQETREGRSSHRSPPHCVLMESGIRPRSGRAIAVEFAWSGDHRLRLDRLPDGTRVLQAGILLAPGELVLEAGGVHEAPPVWLVCSRRGRDGLAARTHDVCRRRILPATGLRRPRPVHLNTWEAVWFDQDPQRLIRLAETAAELGVERFVLDDGWFAGRTDDRRALGDWEVDPERWPGGLDPLVDRVRSLGMEFGLWVEPEMVSDDSALARARPEWIRGPVVAGRSPRTGRHQRVLDLGRPEVVEHLFGVLDGLLCRYDIGYLKWDHNRTLTGQTTDGGPGHLRQSRAVHELLDRLRTRHPRLEIETCASGGGRADWGMLARTHRVWTSDCNDPVTRARIMAGVGPHLPPEVAGVHLGPERAWLTGRITGLDFRAAVGLLGAFGLELDPTGLSAGERSRLKELVDRYRRWREVLHGGRQATPVDDEDHLVRVVTAPERDRALVVVLRLDDRVPGRGIRFPLADLDPAGRYLLRLAPPLPDPELRPADLAAMRPWIDGVEADGAWLASVGPTLQLPAPQSAVVLEVERVSSC